MGRSAHASGATWTATGTAVVCPAGTLTAVSSKVTVQPERPVIAESSNVASDAPSFVTVNSPSMTWASVQYAAGDSGSSVSSASNMGGSSATGVERSGAGSLSPVIATS